MLRLLRPQQWIKNFFVLLPMFFSGRAADAAMWLAAAIAFAAFAAASSAVYCLNDVIDADTDRRHPAKKQRPVAAGQVSKTSALTLMAFMAVIAMALPAAEGCIAGTVVIGAYLLLNVAYCFWLKRIPIVDIIVIALGFVLRVVIGGVLCAIWVSPWLICMTFLLALFLALAKRRDDVLLRLGGNAIRPSANGYSLSFVNTALSLLAAITIVCYLIYTLSPEVMARLGSQYVYITAIFVIAGMLRYLQLAIVEDNSGSPTAVLGRDRFLQACVVLWVITFVVIIYL